MNKGRSIAALKLFLKMLIVVLTCMQLTAFSQQLSINTKDIQLLIEEWNIIHNGRTMKGFEEVYADKLLFYTQTVTKDKAIAYKERLFRRRPGFRQRIASDIIYTAYSKGVVKCDFTKEVWQDSAWVPYPSYLLVSYEDGRNRIVGESDLQTDDTFKFTPDIGEPLKLNLREDDDDSLITTGALANDSTTTAGLPDSTGNSGTTTTPSGIVPKGYIFMFIAVVVSGGVLYFLLRTFRSRSRITSAMSARPTETTRSNHEQTTQPEASITRSPEEPVKYSTAASRVAGDSVKTRNDSYKQIAFQQYLITLFDPLHFNYEKPKSKSVSAGTRIENEAEPSIEFQFMSKDGGVTRFAIQSCFKEDTNEGELRLFSADQLQFNSQFEGEVELYYVVGLGGLPDHPKEVYLIPSRFLKTEIVSREAIKPFRKLGMFFYNVSLGRLQ